MEKNEGLIIQLEYYDARSRLIKRLTRKDVQIDLRKIENKTTYNEIRIKGLRTVDIFVTNVAQIMEDRCTDVSVYIWISNYKCAITVSGAPNLLSSIKEFVQPTAITNENIENESPNHNTRSPTKGKRSFGIVNKDLIKSGCSPEAKIRVTHLKMKPLSSEKKGNEIPSNNNWQRELDTVQRPRQTTFMGMLAAASIPADPTLPSYSFELTEVQKLVIEACSNGKNVFYTGGAGTGKSTLLTRLIDTLVEQHGQKHVFVAATTGLAACAVGGTTVHQFAGISSMLDESLDVAALKLQFDRIVNQSCAKMSVVRRFRDAKVLLVDEISMLSPVLLEVSVCRGILVHTIYIYLPNLLFIYLFIYFL
jgi:hypothetical protein